ncbi:hypothetical protein [Ruminococcus sp.]|uniref:hypothetical protein n=1 Tax=Ruminococcus sp. TaxID=41978 RepID=UPI003992A7AF
MTIKIKIPTPTIISGFFVFTAMLCAFGENDEFCCGAKLLGCGVKLLGCGGIGGGVFAVPHLGQNLAVSFS